MPCKHKHSTWIRKIICLNGTLLPFFSKVIKHGYDAGLFSSYSESMCDVQ
jgi:hypothetical protein